MKNNRSLNNRHVALARWRNVRENIRNHLEKISSEQKYHLLKARLHAFLAGDGYVSVTKEKNGVIHHSFGFYPDHESMIPPFMEAIKYLYLQTLTVEKAKNYYKIRGQSQAICLDLLQLGKFGSLEWSIPFEILISVESKREWLRAFFDCKAYVGKTHLRVQSVNRIGLEQARLLLAEFGIQVRIYVYTRKNPNWNINYILNIAQRESRRTYLKEIGFNHTIKQQKLRASVAEPG